MKEYDFDDNDFGLYDGQCVGCDAYNRVDDMGLCEECAGKLERDLIRQRNWNYSALAFGCTKSRLEDLRKEIISKYGEKLELIAPDNKNSKKKQKRFKRNES